MAKNLTEMRYYATYYFTNIVHNILTDPYSYLLNIHSWYEDCQAEIFLPSFPKWSRLHGIIMHIVQGVVHEEINEDTIDSILKDRTYNVWVDSALQYYNLPCHGFRAWLKEEGIKKKEISEDHLDQYQTELFLSGHLEELMERITKEVFFILFGNRQLLATFNIFVSGIVQDLDSMSVPEELALYLDRPGILRRVPVPAWAKNAVYFRDRGMCASCNRDISGLLTSQPERHYDHIVPLAEGGINDVTNIQLLCAECNHKKGRKFAKVSAKYESWY